jgi:hypothetical protein
MLSRRVPRPSQQVERLVPRLAELNNQRTREDVARARRRYYPTKGSRRHVLPTSCAGVDPDAAREEGAGGGGVDAGAAAAAGASGGGATYSEKFRKLFPVSERMVLDLLEGRDVALQHNISLQEAAVVNARSSCAVMGRSGTGKTTCCLFRLLATARGAAWQGAQPLRQVCVCARSSVQVSHGQGHDCAPVRRMRAERRAGRQKG